MNNLLRIGVAAASTVAALVAMLLGPDTLYGLRPAVHGDAARVLASVAEAPALQLACSVNAVRLNLRSGPGTTFDVVEQLAKGTAFVAVERNADSTWLFGNSPENAGWTAPRFLDCPGDISGLPIKAQTSGDAAPAPATPVAAPQPSAPASGSQLKLIQPLDGRFSGRQTFIWQTTTALGPNQGYELVLWEDDQNPMRDGFGLAEPKREDRVTVDLDKLTAILPRLRFDRNYHWGVLLVQVRPYRRLQHLGGDHRFLFAPPVSGGTDDSGSSGGSTGPTPPAPPKPPK